MKLHFCSLNRVWCDEVATLFPESQITCGDVQTIPKENTVFVSPANCLGFMDGGIDYVYSRKMFPGCEKLIRNKIKELGFKTFLERNYLRIGSALCIGNLICAPTMFLPHDVSKTRNAYYSFLAALLVAQKMGKFTTIVVTSHCCGYGKMLETESAKQMREAYDEFILLDGKQHSSDTSVTKDVVLMPNYDSEQPDNYDNREIKEIAAKNIIRV